MKASGLPNDQTAEWPTDRKSSYAGIPRQSAAAKQRFLTRRRIRNGMLTAARWITRIRRGESGQVPLLLSGEP